MSDVKLNDLNLVPLARTLASSPLPEFQTTTQAQQPQAQPRPAPAPVQTDLKPSSDVQAAPAPSANAPPTNTSLPAVSADEQTQAVASFTGKTRESIKQQQKDLQDAVARLNDYVQSVQRDLQFEMDDDSGRTVIRVLERSTQSLVRQIPEDVILKLARNLHHDEPLSLISMKV